MSKCVGGTVGFIFAGIGLTTLVFLWGAPFGEFGSPPLFFRIFGSFISLAFVVVGGSVFIGSIMGIKAGGATDGLINGAEEQKESSDDASAPNPSASYTCARCGAPLGKGVEVSPHGDVKCGYCGAWFNIHGK